MAKLKASFRLTAALFTEDQVRARANKGHGHVFPRADGVKAKCGGPSMCLDCKSDNERKIDNKLERLRARRTGGVEPALLNASFRLMSALKDGSGQGTEAAGVHMMAASTGRYLLGLRGAFCASPNTWACFAGTREPNETPEETARREFREETGYVIDTPLHHIHTTTDPDSGFKFHNYMTIVPDEFEPHLCEETQKHMWAEPGKFPDPLHPGFKDFLRTHGDHLQDYSDSTEHLIDPEYNEDMG